MIIVLVKKNPNIGPRLNTIQTPLKGYELTLSRGTDVTQPMNQIHPLTPLRDWETTLGTRLPCLGSTTRQEINRHQTRNETTPHADSCPRLQTQPATHGTDADNTTDQLGSRDKHSILTDRNPQTNRRSRSQESWGQR